MPGKDKISALILIVIVCSFSFGLYRLFSLRFEKGDVYPPYSSLRSDPLGSKAFYSALGYVHGIDAQRNFLDPSRLKRGRGQTIFYLGVDASLMHSASKKQIDDFEALASNGNRLVIAFVPVYGEPSRVKSEKGAVDTGKDRNREEQRSCVPGKWGITPGYFTQPQDTGKESARALRENGEASLPPAVSWHSNLFFRIDSGQWQPVYSVAGKPVAIERTFGSGSIVILSDSYLASNEAMRNERYPQLLAWLQGSNRAAVFDEFHLGVYDSPGIMSLVRKYHLAPFILGLIMLAGLYLWKSSVPLVPAAGPVCAGEDGDAADKDNFSGLVTLLRRTVAPESLLEVCFREWSKSFPRESRVTTAMLEQVHSVLNGERATSPAGRNPLAGYRKISKILTERKYR